MSMDKNDQDELKLYRGMDWPVNSSILIRQPTLGSICEYGEQEYFSMVHTLCSVGADLKWQLDELGVDYTKISDYELFLYMLARGLTKAHGNSVWGYPGFFPDADYVQQTAPGKCSGTVYGRGRTPADRQIRLFFHCPDPPQNAHAQAQ